MGWLAALIAQFAGGMLLSIAGSLVGRVLTAVGVGAVSYVGVNTALTFFKNAFVSAAGSLPANILGILSLMEVGTCVSMICSAMVMRLTLQGMTSDTIKGWARK